jgi:amidohydrolase
MIRYAARMPAGGNDHGFRLREKSMGYRRSRYWFPCAFALAFSLFWATPSRALDQAQLDRLMQSADPNVLAWRRDIHANPELSNREFRTSKLVAAQLKKFGLEVETGIAHTGVVALLKGKQPGPTIALRADMDALPVTEKTDVPFRSRATSTYRGETVGVMHACGHDAHTAILLGVAQSLAGVRDSLPGNVLFIFQPAEEGAPAGEKGGAGLMLEQGIFDKYKPEVIFGLHMWTALPVGTLGYRSGPIMAASDAFTIRVKGKQSHGSKPWQGVDPIVTASQIVEALQTVVSRRIDITENPAVVTVGAIKAGIRFNIIPDQAEMIGTFRTFTDAQRSLVIEEMKRIVAGTAAASGATAELTLEPGNNPVNVNDPALTEKMLPTLRRVAGDGKVVGMSLITGAEDFALYAKRVPALFFFVGITPPEQDPLKAPANHSDFFYVDERSLPLGMRALAQLAIDYLASNRRT